MRSLGLGLLIWLGLVCQVALGANSLRGRSIVVTPVITASAYAQGDIIGTVTAIPSIAGVPSGVVEVNSVIVVDKASKKAALTLLIFNKAVVPTSADNSAVSITDAIMVDSLVGRVNIAAADYVQTAVNSDAEKVGDWLWQVQGGRDLYMVLVCADAGTCDYDTVSDLSFRFSFLE